MLSPSSPSCWQSKPSWCSRLNDMSPAGVRDRLDVAIKQKSFRSASGGQLQVLGRACVQPGPWRGRRAGGPVRLRQDHAVAHHRRARSRVRGRRGGCPPTARSAWCSRSRACCPGARSSRNVRLAAPHADAKVLDTLFQTLGLAAHRDHYPGELSLGLARRVALARAVRGRARPSCCSTSRSCRSTTRWRHGCATSSPSWSRAAALRPCW